MNPIATDGTPCLLTRAKMRGNWPSIAIWCRPRAQPMIAFSADSSSATISMIEIAQFRNEPALPPNSSPANVTKTVFGSKPMLASCSRPRITTNDTGIMM